MAFDTETEWLFLQIEALYGREHSVVKLARRQQEAIEALQKRAHSHPHTVAGGPLTNATEPVKRVVAAKDDIGQRFEDYWADCGDAKADTRNEARLAWRFAWYASAAVERERSNAELEELESLNRGFADMNDALVECEKQLAAAQRKIDAVKALGSSCWRVQLHGNDQSVVVFDEVLVALETP